MLALSTDTPAKLVTAIGIALASVCLIQEHRLIESVDAAESRITASLAETRQLMTQQSDRWRQVNEKMAAAGEMFRESKRLGSEGALPMALARYKTAEEMWQVAQGEQRVAFEIRDRLEQKMVEVAGHAAAADHARSAASQLSLVYLGGILAGIGIAGLGLMKWASLPRNKHVPLKSRLR